MPTVFVGRVEAVQGFDIRRVAFAVRPGLNVAKLNAVLRDLAAKADGAMWDRNFGAPRKDFRGKRVNYMHLPPTGALPDFAAALSAAGFGVSPL